ncbi:PLDc_N domain-containing protein [Microbacterium jejuense]|uniref:PLDc_N domain-containing protein n=1 Tax=Microbacterium jejuense TaxID=1263637 RepID=A0ABS7HQ04_9MICO|nr:PLD nuclease N-terminal domain-containing protein [Microbacterium jejuense]MBW9094500.1 PLDc_N domain-containing protein [Microbacterium jejuense]
MSDENNPLVPAAYDITWSIVAVVVIALTCLALISLIRSGRPLSLIQATIWTLLILVVPVLGPIAWLAVGRRAAVAQGTTETTNS